MSKDDFTCILREMPIRLMREAINAFDFAYHNSDFSGGFAIIEKFPNTFIVKKNKAGYSVWLKK